MLCLTPLFHFCLTLTLSLNWHSFTYDKLSSSVLSLVPMMQKLSFMLLFNPVLITEMPFTSACQLPLLLDYNIFKIYSAARILTRTKRSAHITPIIADLHWLPVAYRIMFKIILLTFKALNGLAPYYLCNLLLPYPPRRSLRSSDSRLLAVPRYHLSSMGGRSFSVVDPKLCNSLPRPLCLANSLSEFKSQLKTHLFSELYLS